ncbi:cytochrome b [Granulosicoccus sp. 3-233]|uniref:cytochrome b n=1 Tax=Granulosicoccus sp. 3-233 TaxID=3417969 RepID=UPI003D32B9AC
MSGNSDNVIFYTPLQRRLHWLVLLLLIVQYSLQIPMERAMQAIEREEALGFLSFLVTTLHTWGGIAIGAIMIWRWQLRRRVVPLAGGTLSGRQERFVRWHHVALYAVLLLMVVTGVVHYYFGFQPAGRWHEWGKWLLAGLIAIHVAGALSHGRQGLKVLHRMMGRDGLR